MSTAFIDISIPYFTKPRESILFIYDPVWSGTLRAISAFSSCREDGRTIRNAKFPLSLDGDRPSESRDYPFDNALLPLETLADDRFSTLNTMCDTTDEFRQTLLTWVGEQIALPAESLPLGGERIARIAL